MAIVRLGWDPTLDRINVNRSPRVCLASSLHYSYDIYKYKNLLTSL